MSEKCILLLLNFLVFPISDSHVQLRIAKKIAEFGENLTLVCILDKTLEKHAVTSSKRWYKEPGRLCSINGITTDHTKYSASVDDEGAKLTILNFNLEDVNQTYFCEIGFNSSTKLILSKKIVFQDEKSENENDDNPANHDKKQDNTFTPVVIGICCAAFLVMGTSLGCYLKKHRCKKKETPPTLL